MWPTIVRFASVVLGFFSLTVSLYSQYAIVGHSLRTSVHDHFGIESTGSDYATRQLIGNTLDGYFAPQRNAAGAIQYHPFLFPETTEFIQGFYLKSLDIVLEELKASKPVDGVKLYFLSGSGIIAEFWHSDTPCRIAMDFSDLTWTLSAQLHPHFPNSEYLRRVKQLAIYLDYYTISHSHADHVSFSLSQEMLRLGKTVLMPASMRAAAILLGANPDLVRSPKTGSEMLGPIKLDTYNGSQLGTVQNNAYFLTYNTISVCHIGDDDTKEGMLAFAEAFVSAINPPTRKVAINLNPGFTELVSTLNPTVTLQTPVWEFSHFLGYGWTGMKIRPVFDPQKPIPLFWGEQWVVSF